MKRFPFGLTLAAGAVFAILVGLGVWQLQRLAQTNALKARIAALAIAPAAPLETVLAGARGGRELDHRRVSLACLPPAGRPSAAFRYSLRDGVIGWRALVVCRLAVPGFDGVLLDRGLATGLTGAMAPPPIAFADPAAVTGVLRQLGRKAMFGDAMASGRADVRLVRVIDRSALNALARAAGVTAPLPYYLAVETERPAPWGLAPTPVTEDTPRDNLGYALTWFGLAAGLAWIYLAMVWRRLRA